MWLQPKPTWGLVLFLSGNIFLLYLETRFEQMYFCTVYFCVVDFYRFLGRWVSSPFKHVDLRRVSRLTIPPGIFQGFASIMEDGIGIVAWIAGTSRTLNTVCISLSVFTFQRVFFFLSLRMSFTFEERFCFWIILFQFCSLELCILSYKFSVGPSQKPVSAFSMPTCNPIGPYT